MKKIKQILVTFCVVFTIITILGSFTRNEKLGNYFYNVRSCNFGVDEVVQNGQKYIVVTTKDGGVAICKE